MSGIRCEDISGTAVVTLSRPPANALDAAMVHDLRTAFEGYADDPPLGLVLTHDGPTFCAGVDVKALPSYGPDERRSMADEINAMILALYGLPTATVVAVNGHVIGAGFVLMLACDVRLAADTDLKLGLTEVTAGVPYPGGPLEVVRAELDATQQRRLALTGDLIDPKEALRAGILDELHASGDLLANAIETARARSAAAAYSVIKKQLRGPVLERMKHIVQGPAAQHW